MKVSRKTLTNLNACDDGLIWFDKQDDKELSVLVKNAIKEKGEALNHAGWGLCAVMTKEQRTEWAIFSARQVEHLWKDKYPKEYAIWNKWASGEDRRDAARDAAWVAARDAARAATGAAAWVAARAATGAAAWVVAWVVAGDAARAATGDAAWVVAWDDVRAATGAAAWVGAWVVAGDAARDDVREKTLCKILRYGVKIVYEGEK